MSLDFFTDLSLLRQIALGILAVGAVLGVWRSTPLYPAVACLLSVLLLNLDIPGFVQPTILPTEVLFTPDWWFHVARLCVLGLLVALIIALLVSLNRTTRLVQAIAARESQPQPWAEHE